MKTIKPFNEKGIKMKKQYNTSELRWCLMVLFILPKYIVVLQTNAAAFTHCPTSCLLIHPRDLLPSTTSVNYS